MSLTDFLKQNQIDGMYPFHMPGHKRNRDFIDLDVLGLDITEIHGADNLHNPTGLIKNIQERLAGLYESEESLLLVNGSSGGIIAAILSVCGDGDKILVAGNCHRSVYSGLILSGASPVYIYPEINPAGFCMGINPADVAAALNADKTIKAVIVTSPTYEGVCSDIGKIAEIAHAASAVLIVDEAHGAHFGFHEYFPESSVKKGADIVVHSLHKTMPVLTQTSAIHINGQRIDRRALRATLSMTQTSSPSYILMSAAETFVEKFRINSKIYFDNYADLLYSVRNGLGFAQAINLSEPGEIYDRGKILLCTGSRPDGVELERILREKFRIEIEMSGPKHVLAMTSVADSKEGFDRLLVAVMTIDAGYSRNTDDNSDIAGDPKQGAAPGATYFSEFKSETQYTSSRTQIMTPREAFRLSLKSAPVQIDYMLAAGKISAGFVVPYPPGVPVLVPGERITALAINMIDRHRAFGLSVLGIEGTGLQIFDTDA